MSSEERGGAATRKWNYVALLSLLLFFIVIMAATLVVVERGKGINATLGALTAEQRLLSRGIVTAAFQASQGEGAGFERLRDARDRFEAILAAQAEGDATLNLPVTADAATAAILQNVAAQWREARASVDVILDGRDAVLAVSRFGPLVDQLIPELVSVSEQVATDMVAAGADAQQTYMVTRQLLLAQRLASSVNDILAGGSGAATAADRLGRDVTEFGRVLRGLASGDAALGVQAVTALSTAARVSELQRIFADIEREVARILGSSPELFQVQAATERLVTQGDALLARVDALATHYRTANVGAVVLPGGVLTLNEWYAYGFGLIALLLLVAVARVQNAEARLRLEESEQRKRETEEQNRRNQEAILRLLDELGDLAEGDLTVQASVTEDITGAIADSVNFAIEALRDLVSTINNTSEQMAAAAQDTRGVADRLARAAEQQAREIESSSGTVTQMARSMDEVSERTAASAEVAEKSVGIAHEGGERVRRTIQGMDAIREHIQETSKRIKRLGESSQEIGDIVALINDIADQTNILALNAAIQASAAGEAGRGFAVVADEVQRLAERSGNATKRIEALVKTIQADTNEAIISMEKSTTEVVNGADLAEKAGEALEEIETVSARLAELIGEVSRSAGHVTEMASRVAGAMSSINEITAQTAETSVSTASSVAKLNQLAQELQQSVAGFRLPAEQAPQRAAAG